jgi:PAS domain S-box-containing protein
VIKNTDKEVKLTSKGRPGPPENESNHLKSGIGTKNNAGLSQNQGFGLGVLDIINALPFYVIIVDAEHNILEANEAVYTHLGVKREDILGKYCPQVIHGLDHPFDGCPLEEAVEKNQAVETELLDKKTGRWVRSVVFPLKATSHNCKQLFLHIVTDVTERKQAEEQLRTSHEQLRSLSAHLESVREEEKKKIARDLHDETSQLLASLGAHLEAAIETLPEGAGKSETFLRKSQAMSIRILDELHKLIYDLRPALLDELGLMPAISSLADSHLTVSGVKVSLRSSGRARRLPPSLETTLFRVVQEAFSNVVKHAHAGHVRVRMDFKKDRLLISIKDDGTGFDVQEAIKSKDRPRGLGLLNMEERIKLVDGSFTVNSSPGSGTEIMIEVSLKSGGHNG